MRRNTKISWGVRGVSVMAILAQVFSYSALPAQAGLFGGGGSIRIPSPSEVAAELEQRYNLNLESIQNQGQMFNVSDQKKLSPEVSLYFAPSDPRPGEKVVARAFPIYFQNPDDELYYTWYLKRDGCDAGSSNVSDCDRDGSGSVTVNDWKVEAMRYVVQNGFVVQDHTYSSGDDDNDGYRAVMGGENMSATPNWCYVNDPITGLNYELTGGGSGGNSGFGCSAGLTPVCMETNDLINPLDIDPSNASPGFDVTETSSLNVIGTPSCSGSTPVCARGTPCCSSSAGTTCSQVLSSCSSSGVSNGCKHYFANPPGDTNGDGTFGLSEERFWESDPHDPSTAQNSRKDEANTAGLAAQTLKWNYLPGDRVGVLVEGTSLVQTKHDDSSMMIMWALPKNKCYPQLVGAEISSYVKTIKGYAVTIPTTDLDINECIPYNLIDPTEGGQSVSTGLDVTVTTSPENPVNDETTDLAGDTVVAQATIDNPTRERATLEYDWKVDVGRNVLFTSGTCATDCGSRLRELGLLGDTKGNGLEKISLTLNIPRTTALPGGGTLASYLTDDIGMLRFRVTVREIVDGIVVRTGRADAVVRFVSTGKKITASTVTPVDIGGKMQVRTNQPVCNVTPLERNACRVIRNEIIGLNIDPTGLTDFNWTVNGIPLVCSNAKVSPQCRDEAQNNYNFFPVTGNVGEAHTVSVAATDTNSGKTIMLARTFHVVDPFVELGSQDTGVLSPVFLGYYKDILGTTDPAVCPEGRCPNYAKDSYTAVAGSAVTAKATYVPSWLSTRAKSFWMVNNERLPVENVNTVTFNVTNTPGYKDRFEFEAVVQESDEHRKALFDIWNITPLDSTEYHFAAAADVKAVSGLSAKNETGVRKYLAYVSSYVPAAALFALRAFLSGFVLLFVIGMLFNYTATRKHRKIVMG